jgi:hypothetical protein
MPSHICEMVASIKFAGTTKCGFAGGRFEVEHGQCPDECEAAAPLGRHLEGCRMPSHI